VADGKTFLQVPSTVAVKLTPVDVAVREANDAARLLAPGHSDAFYQIVLGIGLYENEFGRTKRSWYYVFADDGASVSPDGAGKMVILPSFNWGGLRAVPSQSAMMHTDTDPFSDHPQALKLERFAVYASVADGFSGFYRTWAKSDPQVAADRGDAYEVARRMYSKGYYQGLGRGEPDILNYARGIAVKAREAAKILGQSSSVFVRARTPPSALEWLLPVGIAGASFYLWRRRMVHGRTH